MKQKRCWHDNNNNFLHAISSLPRKMSSIADQGNVVEFVLHELCNKDFFDISKAAYIINNPDFNCFRGIAGICEEERYPKENIWEHRDDFTEHMRASQFNKKVRSLRRQGCLVERNQVSMNAIEELARELNMHTVGCCNIHTRNNNHGLFIYESSDLDNEEKECLINGISLLSFCPLY